MLAAWGIGWWKERRFPQQPGKDTASKFTDASLALLGLLLAFTFSMSLGRHDHRRAVVLAESNAIGDFYTCASLLKDPGRSRLQAVIRSYALHKLDMARESPSADGLAKALQRCQEMHAQMTDLVGSALAEGTPIANPLTNTLNNLTSSDAARLAGYRARLPWSIVVLLFLSAVIPAFLVGQQQGATRMVHVAGTFCFFLLVALVIGVTLDLNQPDRGLITVSQEPLERLIQGMPK
jgi:hypothetical protein